MKVIYSTEVQKDGGSSCRLKFMKGDQELTLEHDDVMELQEVLCGLSGFNLSEQEDGRAYITLHNL